MGRYAEGQVWEYRTRRGEERSRLKIQKVETDPRSSELIYHISIIGLACGALHHAPVCQSTLDKSVIALATGYGQFPNAEDGIAQWRQANGGVYSISIAEIVELGDSA